MTENDQKKKFDNRVGAELNGLGNEDKGQDRREKLLIIAILLGVVFIGSLCATQYVAYNFGYQRALGEPLFGKIYAPWKFFVWSHKWYDRYPELFKLGQSMLLATTGTVAGIIAFYKWSKSMRMKGSPFLHGSAHWASLNDIMSSALLPEVPPKKLTLDLLEWSRKFQINPEPFGVELAGEDVRKLEDRLKESRSKTERATLETKLKTARAYAEKCKTWNKKLYKNGSCSLPELPGVFVGAWENPATKNLHYLRDNGPTHVLMVAPTRSGKGVGPVNDTTLTWRKSLFCYDIKGELWALTSGWRKSIGNTCIKFEPSRTRKNINEGKLDENGNPLPAQYNTARWNPFDEIRAEGSKEYFYNLQTKKCDVRVCTGENEISDTQNTVMLMVDPDGKGLEDHWAKTAFGLLTGCVIHLKHNLPEMCSPQTLCLMLSEQIDFAELRKLRKNPGFKPTLDNLPPLKEGIKNLYNDMKEGLDMHGKLYRASKVVQSAGSRQYSRPDDEAGSVLSTATSLLELYADMTVSENTAHSDFRIAQLMNMENPVSLYLVTQPADKGRLTPLVRLIINSIIRLLAADMKFAGGRSVDGFKHKLLLMLDEFPSLGKLDILQESLAYIAGYGMKAFLITQDMVQLRDKYGQNESVSANCHISLWYAPLNNDTAKIMSEKIGTTTIVKENVSISGSGLKQSKSRSIQETGRALLTPDECMSLRGAVKDNTGNITQAGAMIITPSGKPTIYGLQPLYFQNPILRDRAKVPTLEYSEWLLDPDTGLSIDELRARLQED